MTKTGLEKEREGSTWLGRARERDRKKRQRERERERSPLVSHSVSRSTDDAAKEIENFLFFPSLKKSLMSNEREKKKRPNSLEFHVQFSSFDSSGATAKCW